LVQRYLQADRDNSNDPDETPSGPTALIGYSALVSESHVGMVEPMVLSPQKPVTNPAPDNSKKSVATPTLEQL
jgi:hypothetical protein